MYPFKNRFTAFSVNVIEITTENNWTFVFIPRSELKTISKDLHGLQNKNYEAGLLVLKSGMLKIIQIPKIFF